MLDRITENFYALDDKWTITYVNDAVEREFGVTRDEFLGQNIWERFPQIRQTPLAEALQQASVDGKARTAEFFHSETHETFEARIYPSDNGLSVFFRNITDRRQQQEALEEALQAAQAGVHTKTRFLATMSHELRTPLQTIVGYADLLLGGGVGPLTPVQAEDIGVIHRAATRMTTLIDELLALSRAESSRAAATLDPDELMRIVELVRQEAAPLAAAKHLALVVDIPTHLEVVHGDLVCLHRVLLNLVWNAIKFTHVGEVTISIAVSDTEIAVTVRDTGIGIAAEALPHIFDEFYQVDNSLTRRYEGAGLGLAIARRFAEQMGARITVASRPREGSAFTLHLAVV